MLNVYYKCLTTNISNQLGKGNYEENNQQYIALRNKFGLTTLQ